MALVLRDDFPGVAGTLLSAHTPEIGTGTWQAEPNQPYTERMPVLDGAGRAVCTNQLSNNNEAGAAFFLPLGHGTYTIEALFSTPNYNDHIRALAHVSIGCAGPQSGYVQLLMTNSNSIAGPPSFQVSARSSYVQYTNPTTPAQPWALRLVVDSIARTAKGYFNSVLIGQISLTNADFHADDADRIEISWAGASGTDTPWRMEFVSLDYVHVNVPDPDEPVKPTYPAGGLRIADAFDGPAAESIDGRVPPTHEGLSSVEWSSSSGGGLSELNGTGEVRFEAEEV